jgi:hypothetical protein
VECSQQLMGVLRRLNENQKAFPISWDSWRSPLFATLPVSLSISALRGLP